MNKIILLIIAVLTTGPSAGTENFELEEKKIKWLISEVGVSKAVFIRNGDEHTSKKAASHLEYKWKRAKKPYVFFGDERFLTVDQFIEHIASKSSTTGKDYQVIIPGGKTVTTNSWLKNKLKDYPNSKETGDDKEKP